MNDSTAHAMQSLAEDFSSAISQPELISDDNIDYQAIMASTRPGQPGSAVVFDSDDYATDEEAMSALEALMIKWIEGAPDEKAA